MNSDVGISKKAVVGANNGLVYWLDVTNYGPQPASGVVVTDVLPGVTMLRRILTSGSGDWNCTYSASGLVQCSFNGNLPAGRQASIALAVTARGATQPFTNCASVSTSTYDSNQANNSSCVTLSPTLRPVAAVASGDKLPGETARGPVAVAVPTPQAAQPAANSGQVASGQTSPAAVPASDALTHLLRSLGDFVKAWIQPAA